MKNLRNSCGSSGCNVPEHDKRLGYDNTNILRIDLKNKVVMTPGSLKMGPFVQFLKDKFGTEWENVHVHSYVELNHTVSN